MYQRSKIMKRYFLTIAALAVSLMGGLLVPALKADEWNKSTKITIDQSIDVQGTVLPAGSYVIKLLSANSDRHTLLIFNAAEDHLITTVLAIPAYRLTPTGDTRFKFYEAAPGQPQALHTWFYPGDNFGFEFRAARENAASNSTHSNTQNAVASVGSQN
jgi:hypothetical protein